MSYYLTDMKHQIHKLLKGQTFKSEGKNYKYLKTDGIWSKCKDSSGEIAWFSPLPEVELSFD